MRRLFILMSLCVLTGILSAQTINFADSRFKEAIFRKHSAIDSDDNGEIEVLEANAFEGTLDLSSGAIADLSEIKYFTKITELNCSANNLTTIDLSKNTQLTDVQCHYNKIETLNLQNCTKLTRLVCFGNQLKSLNLDTQGSLKELDCGNNLLESLDLSHCRELTRLDCYDNKLTSLSFMNNSKLGSVVCSNNNLTSLDFSSQNSSFWQLVAENNELTSLTFPENVAIIYLKLNNNRLSLSQLDQVYKQLKDKNVLSYSSTKFLVEGKLINKGGTLTFTEEQKYNGINTSFIWYDKDENENPASITALSSNQFSFAAGGSFYCVMRNVTIPNVSVRSSIVEVSSATAIDDVSSINDFKVFPNPAMTSDKINMEFPEGIRGETTVSVYTLSGTCVYEKAFDGRITQLDAQLDQGLYIICLKANGNVAARRLLVK